MDQRNKWEQELDKLTDQAFKETDSELFNLYRNKLIEIKKSVKYYTDTYPNLSFSKKLEIERQLQVGAEIQQILAATSKDVYHTIEDYATNQGELGYNGVFYAIEGVENVTLPFTLINHDYIKKALNKPVAGKRLSKRLYQNQDHLAKVSTQALIDGLWDGNGYPEIAKRITDQTEASYRQALRIARTEGGRIRSLTTQKGYDHAADLGIDFDKHWLATSDSRTRHDHSELNGQTVPYDGQFKIRGHRADGPRLFGVASEDINCRCTTITKIKDMPAEYKNKSQNEKLDAEAKQYDYSKWLNKKATKAEQDAQKNRTYDKPTVKMLQDHADYIKHPAK